MEVGTRRNLKPAPLTLKRRAAGWQSGVLYQTQARDPLGHLSDDCHAPWDANGNYLAVTCPDGYFLDSLDSVGLACQRSNLYCPADLVCLCRPCIQDMVLYMYPVQVRRAARGCRAP